MDDRRAVQENGGDSAHLRQGYGGSAVALAKAENRRRFSSQVRCYRDAVAVEGNDFGISKPFRYSRVRSSFAFLLSLIVSVLPSNWI
jgi:hypothetical protein